MADRKKLFVLYDERARYTLDTDDASVMVSASSEREARSDSRMFMDMGAIWYEYDVAADGKTLINERERSDIPTSWKELRAEKKNKKVTA